jgi:hypothetical protein
MTSVESIHVVSETTENRLMRAVNQFLESERDDWDWGGLVYGGGTWVAVLTRPSGRETRG